MKVHWKKHGQPILAYVYLIYCRNTRAWKIHGAFPGRNGKVSTQLKFSWVLGTQHVSGVSSPGHETPKRVTWRGEKMGAPKVRHPGFQFKDVVNGSDDQVIRLMFIEIYFVRITLL